MKIAIFTATIKNDYKWYSSDNSFKNVAKEQWLCWHNEIYDGAWFGLTSQNGQTFFLAGKIPTKRCDGWNRNIIDYIVLQSETPEERKQLALLTSDLLKNRQDINDVDSPFTIWADEVCVSIAEKDSYDYTPFPILETSLSSESEASIGRFEYSLISQTERDNVANALGSLLEKDFLIGCIQYRVEKFLSKAGKNLSSDAQIAVFSARTDSKKEIPVTQVSFPGGNSISAPNGGTTSSNSSEKDISGTKDPFLGGKSISTTNGGTTSNNALKMLLNPLSIGVLTFLIMLCLLWHQNSQKTTQIQNLNNQISSLEEALEKASNELQAKKAEIEELKKQINSSKELPPTPQDSPAQDSGSPVE